MRRQLKLTILNRLIISYLVIIVLVIGTGTYTVFALYRLGGVIDDITACSRIVRLGGEAANGLYTAEAAGEKYRVSGDRDYLDQYREAQADLGRRITDIGRYARTAEQKNLLDQIALLQRQYEAALEAAPRGQQAVRAAGTMPETPAAVADRLDGRLTDLVRTAARERDERIVLSREISTDVADLIAGTVAASIILMIVLSIANTRSINAPIRLLREKTREIARGDYGTPVTVEAPPEIRELGDAFNVMCDRLKELDQMKLDFISHLSHELRTPLTAIKEATSMLREGIFAESPDKQQELLAIVEGECGRLIDSVSRILDLSRMEAGMMDFTFEPFNIAPLVEKEILKLSPIAERRKIKVVADLPDALPAVRMDIEKIEQVIENLLGNALKFTPEGGRVAVAAQIRASDGALVVSVSDTGPGIPEEGLKEVFEKFKRVEEKRGAVRGSGLGLAIAKHIVDAHGGHIWAESRPGEGSTFFFSLPVSH